MKTKKQIRKIWGVFLFLWMITIFLFSQQPGDDSSGTSHETTRKVVQVITMGTNLTEQEKEQMVEKVNPVIRKIAHYTAYLIGGIILFGFLQTFPISVKKAISYSIIGGIFYATSDEIHQYFIAGRSANIADVWIDTLGVITGICLFQIVQKSKEKK